VDTNETDLRGEGHYKKVLIHIANIILGFITIGFSGIMWVAIS